MAPGVTGRRRLPLASCGSGYVQAYGLIIGLTVDLCGDRRASLPEPPAPRPAADSAPLTRRGRA